MSDKTFVAILNDNLPNKHKRYFCSSANNLLSTVERATVLITDSDKASAKKELEDYFYANKTKFLDEFPQFKVPQVEFYINGAK